jgi:hypothetical protein
MPSGSAMVRAQHLIAAAQAEHPPAPAQNRGEIDVPALFAKESEITACRFRAGNDDEIGIERHGAPRCHHLDGKRRIEGERVEIVEIGNPREARHGDTKGAIAARGGNVEGILGG